MKIIKRFLIEKVAPIKELVKDSEWQKLREDLKGKWTKDPLGNCHKLRSYLGSMNDEKKLRIVMNYLVGSGFRTGKIKHPCIQKLRNDISKALKENKK